MIRKFEEDCHESSTLLYRNDREFGFAMTGKSAPRHRTTERYRAAQGRNDYTNLPHDLAARPADKFQFVSDNGRKTSVHRPPLKKPVYQISFLFIFLIFWIPLCHCCFWRRSACLSSAYFASDCRFR